MFKLSPLKLLVITSAALARASVAVILAYWAAISVSPMSCKALTLSWPESCIILAICSSLLSSINLASLSCSATLAIPSCLTNILAISSLDIPIDLAIASCCNTFIFPKLSAVIFCLLSSSARPTISPLKAAILAFSKFNCLPVSNSASSSAEIEDSKSNKLPAILSSPDISRPNFLAVNAALANPPENFDVVKVVAADILPISSITALTSTAVPSTEFKAFTVPNISALKFSNSLPVAAATSNNPLAACWLIPILRVNV